MRGDTRVTAGASRLLEAFGKRGRGASGTLNSGLGTSSYKGFGAFVVPAQPRGLQSPEAQWGHWTPEVALHRAEWLLSSSLRSDLATLGFRSLRHARVRQRMNCELNSPDSRLCTANLRATFPRGEAASRHFPSNSETRKGKVSFVRLAAESHCVERSRGFWMSALLQCGADDNFPPAWSPSLPRGSQHPTPNQIKTGG